MRKGQRASSSSGSEEDEEPRSTDSKRQLSPRGCSSGDESSSDSDVEVECVMKRSQRFSGSFSFREDNKSRSRNEDTEEVSPKDSNGVHVPELTGAGVEAECDRLEKRNTFCNTDQPPRSGLFRPQELWLAMTRCLSLRWPPCLSIFRQSNGKLAYQADLDQLEDTQTSVSSSSTNESYSSKSTSNDRDVILVKHEEEEVKSSGFKSGPPRFRGVSRSSPRMPRARQPQDSLFASMILERETFLRIELVDSGDDREDLRYRAEWKLSERTKELAEGVWLSRSQKLMD